jgi:RNA polymerase sigma-70 factor (ECF subfamily)
LESIIHIIRGCIHKEYKYQKILYENYRGFAAKIVFRYIYNYEKSGDVVNDGFIKLFNHFERFNLAESEETNRKLLMGYIKRIMVNGSIDALRRASMLPEIGGFPEFVWEYTSREHDADLLVRYKQIIIMIKDLPAQYRIIFNMYVIDGYSHQEIAQLLHVTAGTSKSGLSRAKAILRDKIKKEEEILLCRI